jgi:hypothetical protein
MIGGIAPSKYLPRVQKHKQVQLDDVSMDLILESHLIPADSLRADDFYGFHEKRKSSLLALIASVMGKEPLPGATLADVDERSDDAESQRMAA